MLPRGLPLLGMEDATLAATAATASLPLDHRLPVGELLQQQGPHARPTSPSWLSVLKVQTADAFAPRI